MKRNKQAISLIVLVITIIVMIVLAGAIILTLNNSGIIEKAQNAVDSTNEATVKEVATLGWAEAYADGARTEEELRAGVLSAFEKNNIDTEDYGMIVTTSGVTIKKGWLKDGFTVVKGDQVLELGDVVNYDAGVSTYTEGWKVLGADAEGNLLIMSSGSITQSAFKLGWEDTTATNEAKLAESIKDFETGVEQLNEVCEPFGHGKGTVGTARSVRREDIIGIIGYTPSENITPGPVNVCQYGNKVTLKYNGTTQPLYESEAHNSRLQIEHKNGFYYYNGEKIVHINDLLTGTSGATFATITSNYINTRFFVFEKFKSKGIFTTCY